MKTPEQIAREAVRQNFTLFESEREFDTEGPHYDVEEPSATYIEGVIVAAIEADRAQRVDAVSAERKKIASMLMQQGDRMDGEGTQAGYYAAAHLVRERERSA